MSFFKKLFTGIGFAAGFLFFGCLSVIVYASRGRHKPCHRRSSFWNTLERYLIFSWICDGVRSSRKRAEKSYYQRTGGDFWQMQTQARPASVKNSAPEVKTPRPEAKNTGTGAMRSVKPKRTERPSAAQKAAAAQSSVQNVSVPTVLGQNVSEDDEKSTANGQSLSQNPSRSMLRNSQKPKKYIKSPHSNWKQNGSRNWKLCALRCRNKFAPSMQM